MDEKASYHFKRWLIQAVGGLVLIGMGLCFAIESAFLKQALNADSTWIWAGTGSLIVFNSGICLVADSVLHKIKYEQLKEM